MVLIDDKKYACETCIKGHRSSSCKHTDRPLFEIKKKGRPVTQCEHCRELRKTKQVHVKCLCESKEENMQLSTSGLSKKGGNKVPANAVFPNGLPEDLEASVALQLLSEGLSDSDRGEYPLANTCTCKEGGTCECCTPRKSAPRRRKPGDRSSDERDSRNMSSELKRSNKMPADSSPPSSQVLARIAELRRVLPRPSNPSVHLAGSSHDSSPTVAHGHHPMRHYTRDNLFSPYGRAYDMSHGLDHAYGRNNASEQGSAQGFLQDNTGFPRSTVTDSHQFLEMPTRVESWTSNGESVPSACNCGDGCTCPGCAEHNGGGALVPATSAFPSCANPGACSHCLDCTILSLPASLPLDTALSIYDSTQSQSIDEWIRQISNPSNASSGRPPPSLPPDLAMTQARSSSWENYRMPPVSIRNSRPSECCGGQCTCPSGLCTCTGDCCGCCQGYECAHHEHRDNPMANTGGLTFTTSKERQSCCLGAGRRAGRSSESIEDHRNGSRMNLPQAALSSVRMSTEYSGYMDMHGIGRSRSSSSSSSQSQSGRKLVYTDISAIYATPRPNPLRGLPSSDSSSPTHPGVTYATSNPDSEVSSDDQQFETYSQYNPSLDEMQMY